MRRVRNQRTATRLTVRSGLTSRTRKNHRVVVHVLVREQNAYENRVKGGYALREGW